MAARFNTRRVLLFAALALLIAGAVWLREEPEDETAPVEAAVREPRGGSRAKESTAPGPRLPLELLAPRDYAEPEDAFKSETWKPPPPPPASQQQQPPAEPVAPTAPPLPFGYIGRLEEDGRTLVFLTQQDRNYIATHGDVLEGVYRLEEIQQYTVVFTYLPLNLRQSLPIGEAN